MTLFLFHIAKVIWFVDLRVSQHYSIESEYLEFKHDHCLFVKSLLSGLRLKKECDPHLHMFNNLSKI